MDTKIIDKAEVIDNEELTDNCTINKDENGKIVSYTVTSFKKNREPFKRTLSRKEVDLILSMYSIYGENCTKARISQEFPDLTAHDIGRIIKAFGRYKYDTIFSPHQLSECSDKQLEKYSLTILEKKQQKKLEANQQRAKEKVYQETFNELQTYKDFEKKFSNIHVDLSNAPKVEFKGTFNNYNKSIMIHLSDMHVGACCESNPLYSNDYNKDEIYRRLNVSLDRMDSYGAYDTIILNNLGDGLDGMDNQTARRDHIMPQNMDNYEQVDAYLEIMTWYIGCLRGLAKKVKVYSVPCGNHDGIAGQIANMALQQTIKRIYPDIEFVLFADYRDYYEFNGHTFIIEHGKDPKFHKKGLPLNLNDATKVFLFEWLRYKGLSERKNIHFIKGDLHSNNLNSCEAFTYRNVLSLFGASDYSNMNFSRNSYGISYELFIGDNMISGTFENL